MTLSKPVSPESVPQLLSELIQMIVEDTNAVEIIKLSADRNTALTLRVAPVDIGKVIGKQGRTARALRIILAAISQNNGHTYCLNIPTDNSTGGTQ